jgi:hypothetical protein
MKNISFIFLFILFFSCRPTGKEDDKLTYCDSHVHLTSFGESALDSLLKYNVTTVRDCGGDIDLIKKWKNRN